MISTLQSDIVNAIDTTLRQYNIYAKSYQMIHEELQNAKAQNNNQTEPEMQLLFTLKKRDRSSSLQFSKRE